MLEDFMGLARREDPSIKRERAELQKETVVFYDRLFELIDRNGSPEPLRDVNFWTDVTITEFTHDLVGTLTKPKKSHIGLETRMALPESNGKMKATAIKLQTKEYHLRKGQKPKLTYGDDLIIQIAPEKVKDEKIYPLTFRFGKDKEGNHWGELEYATGIVSGLESDNIKSLNLLLDHIGL